MDGSKDNQKTVMIECMQGCSIPSMGIIAEYGEVRSETEDRANLLVDTGRFRIVKNYIAVDAVVAASMDPIAPAPKSLADVVGEKHLDGLAAIGIRTIEDLLATSGSTVSDALIGVGPSTVNKWLKAAKE